MSKFKKKYKWKDREFHFTMLNFRKRCQEHIEFYIGLLVEKEISKEPTFLGISGFLNKIKDK